MENKRDISENIGSEIIIYQTEDGHTKIDVKFEDETVWLTQAQLCELYQTSKSNISEHICGNSGYAPSSYVYVRLCGAS